MQTTYYTIVDRAQLVFRDEMYVHDRVATERLGNYKVADSLFRFACDRLFEISEYFVNTIVSHPRGEFELS